MDAMIWRAFRIRDAYLPVQHVALSRLDICITTRKRIARLSTTSKHTQGSDCEKLQFLRNRMGGALYLKEYNEAVVQIYGMYLEPVNHATLERCHR